MVTDLNAQKSALRGLFVVGSGVDVAAVKAHLMDLVPVPVIAPEEPQLALARGAALASANAPRYDPSTVGVAYSQDPDGTTAHSILVADLRWRRRCSAGCRRYCFGARRARERNKPFLLVGSSLTAIFVAGMMALTIAVAVNVRPTADQGSDVAPVPPGNSAPPPAVRVRRPPRRSRCPRRSRPARGATSCPHRHGTAEGPAPRRHRSGGAQRRARPGGGGARTGRSTPARCGSTGNPAADHPVAGPVCSTDSAATPVLQPAAARPDVVPGPELAVWPRRLHHGHGGGLAPQSNPLMSSCFHASKGLRRRFKGGIVQT